MGKIPSDKYIAQYRKFKIDWWTEEDHMWNQCYLIEDSDFFITKASETAHADTIVAEIDLPSKPAPKTNWQAHLARLKEEREERDSKLRKYDEESDLLAMIGRINTYREYAAKRNLSDAHVQQMVRAMQQDLVKRYRNSPDLKAEYDGIVARRKAIEREQRLAERRAAREEAEKVAEEKRKEQREHKRKYDSLAARKARAQAQLEEAAAALHRREAIQEEVDAIARNFGVLGDEALKQERIDAFFRGEIIVKREQLR